MNIRLTFYLAIIVLTILPAKSYAQEEGLVPYNNGKGFFAIGWSDNGKYLGYGQLEMMQAESFGSGFYAEILDLVSNKSVWHMNKEWWEADGGYYPQMIYEVWGISGSEISQNLKLNGINELFREDPVKNFPILNGDMVNIEIRSAGTSGQEVYLISENLGEKKIFSSDGNISIEGYIPYKDNSIIAVIINVKEDWSPYAEYKITGCHMKTGFKMTVK